MIAAYEYHFGSLLAQTPIVPCEKGNVSNSDPDAFEWFDAQGNVLGVAKEDGTPNKYNSFVTKVTK